jgi:hypothetical protein
MRIGHVVADFGKQGLAELTDYLPEIRWCVVIARRCCASQRDCCDCVVET